MAVVPAVRLAAIAVRIRIDIASLWGQEMATASDLESLGDRQEFVYPRSDRGHTSPIVWSYCLLCHRDLDGLNV